MTGLEDIREALAGYLREHGVNAAPAWAEVDWEKHQEKHQEAVCAVSLRRCESGSAGLGDYLGERYDEKRDRWEELYGKHLKLTFGLDLYAGTGQGGGETAIRRAFDRLSEALHSGGPPGVRVRELTCGETAYESGMGRYRCPVEAVCEACLYAVTDESGAFLDFEVKGVGRSWSK